MKILLAALLLSTSTFARDRDVTVSGVCNRMVTPDRASITLTAEFVSKDLKAAQQKATEAYEETREAIKRLRLEHADVRTSEYSLNELKEWEKDHSVFKGYKARMGLYVATSQVTRMGELIAIGAEKGLKDVGQLRTYLSQEKTLQEHVECLQEAAENARKKADRLASSLGAKLGEVVSISEAGQGSPGPRPLMMEAADMGGARAKSFAAPSVEAGQQEFSLTVQATFGLK